MHLVNSLIPDEFALTLTCVFSSLRLTSQILDSDKIKSFRSSHWCVCVCVCSRTFSRSLRFYENVLDVNGAITGDFNYTVTPLTVSVYYDGKSFEIDRWNARWNALMANTDPLECIIPCSIGQWLAWIQRSICFRSFKI